MKPFTSSVSYSADAAAVRAALIDPAFIDEMAEKLSQQFRGEVRSREVTADGDCTVSRVVVHLPADQLGPANSFLRDGVEATVVQRWEPESGGTHTGSYELTTQPDKAAVSAEFVLTETATGSERRYDGQVNVKVPLIGGTIESKVVERIGGLMGLERRAVEEFLAAKAGKEG